MTKQKSHQTNRVLALGAAGIVRPLCVLLAGLLTGLLYLVLLAGCDIVPFGDNTWVMFDLKRQYIDFFSYYQRIFSGEEGILYSFQTALGSGMIGFFIYYLGNPLFLLLLPFRPDRLPLAVSFVIGVTLILAAMIMAAFLRWYLDEREPDARGFARSMAVIIGAVAWAFSGFLMAHSMNLMWTDVVIFVPVVIYALETGFLTDPASGGAPCLRSRFRALRYTLFIALILLWNYYISYQVLLFVAMWTLVRLWESRAQAPVRIVGRVAAHTFAAVGLDAVVLLPTLFELANSPKDIFQLGLETTGKTLTPVDVFSKAYVLAYDGLQPRFGYPQIYCGILMLLLAVLFFLDGRRTLRERIAAGIPLAVLMTSFCIDAVNLFWHALMEPSGHPYRQAPLYLFVAILCGVRYLAGICGRPPMPAPGGEAGRTESAAASEGASRETSPMPAPGGEAGKSMLRMVLRYAVTLILAEGMFFLVSRGGYDYINPRMLTENAVRIPICLAGLFVCEWLSSREKTGREKNAAGRAIPALILVALAGMLGAELLVNADYTYGWLSYQAETRNHFLEEVDATGAAVAAVKAQDDGFYRMENLTPRQQNDAMMYGYNGVTHYSSAGMVYVRYLLHKLGYNDDHLYTHYGHDNTVTMDMLLGVRYLLSRDETLVHPGYEKLFDKGDTGVGVWRNPYALSAAIAVKDYDLSGITDIDNPYTLEGNPFDLQEDMLRRLTGEPAQVFVPADTEPAEGNGKKTLDLRIIPAVDGEVYMYLDGLMGTVQGLAVYLDDTLLAGYGNASSYKILNLGVHEAGKAFSVRVEGDSDEPDFGEPLFMTEDLQAVAAICDRLRGQEIAFSKDGNAGIRMTVPESCGGIVTSVPFEEGWSVPNEKIYGALMYIPADEVEKHTRNGLLTMRFLPKGMRAGLVVSVITLLLVLLWILRIVKENRRGGNPEKEEKERPAFKSGRTDGAGKIRAVRLLALAAAIAALGFLCARDSRAKEDHTYVRIGGQDIAVCQKEDQAFLFLPSWADPGELRLSEAVQSLHPEILRSEGLPALFINTVSGSLERVYADKEYREAGSIRAFDETGALVYAGGLESIKGRGNYSWMTQEWTKKPFTIRIGDDVPLLGQPAGGKFALLANASDDTLLRNDIGRALQVRMGMRFAERGTYTDLYINGEYMGVYYLCATTDLGSDRIDITKVSPSASGAYLLERELKERYELEWTEQTRGFVTDSEEYFVVRSPKYATEAEVEAIEAYITRAEAAILGESDARCTDYIDLDTFVKTYLTEELLKNYDGGVSSAYYYKDDADGKLYAAPGWDYDMSLGNYLDWMSHENPRTETQLYPYEGASSWFKTLYAGEQFRSMVQACYRMYREDFAQILRGRGETPGAVRGSAGGSDTESPANGRESGQLPLCEANYRMEYARWQEMYDARGEIPGSGAAFGRLEAFAAARMAYLDAIWITG